MFDNFVRMRLVSTTGTSISSPYLCDFGILYCSCGFMVSVSSVFICF
jgi:hypothetical protein